MVFPTVQFLTFVNPFPTYEIKGTPYVADNKMKSIPSSKSSLRHRIKQRKHFGNKKKSLKKNTLQLDFLQQHIEKIRIERIKLSLENEELRLSLHNTESQMAHNRNIPLETLDNQCLSDMPRSPNQDGSSTVSFDSQSEMEDDWMDEFLSTYQELEPLCCHSLEANNWFSEDAFKQAVFVSNPQLKEWVLLFIILFLLLAKAIHNSQVLQSVTSLQFLLYSPIPVHTTRKKFPIKQMCLHPKR